jgi:hypothetical protein
MDLKVFEDPAILSALKQIRQISKEGFCWMAALK